MKITIRKAQAEAIGIKALEKFTQNDRWGFRDEVTINLVGMAPERMDQLEAMITKALGGKEVRHQRSRMGSGVALVVDARCRHLARWCARPAKAGGGTSGAGTAGGMKTPG